jgi:hypothetical protein
MRGEAMHVHPRFDHRRGHHRLLAWSFGTFHALILLLILRLLIYLDGGLGDALSNLSTLAGLAFFAVFWASTWLTTREGARKLDRDRLRHPLPVAVLMDAGAKWAGVNGAVFLTTLLIGASVPVYLGAGLGDAVSLMLGGLGLVPLAFGFGVAFGFLVVLLDATLLEISRRLAQSCVEQGPTGARGA